MEQVEHKQKDYKMSEYTNRADIVYNKLDKLEGIFDDMYLDHHNEGDKHYQINWQECSKLAEKLIADLIQINRDVHYVKSN